ncbi:MAG: NADH-quinone oxidoreductase subunit B family protein [Firmicutes bacterium]|nr:NADH-quinone oxidoreductase subunit B family protein [Bacillota bacterium]
MSQTSVRAPEDLRAAEERLAAARERLKKAIRRSVYVYRIDCGGCNGCEIEIYAAFSPLFDPERLGIKIVATPRHADILVYTGPMTRPMRLPALRAYRAAPDPKIVVAYGACGCSGGIFHDSYGVWGGTQSLFPVDVFIPGCPPTPAATVYGMALALDLLHQKIRGETHTEEGTPAQVPPRYPEVSPGLAVRIDREARRLCGYREGRRIARQYLEFVREGDPLAVDRKVKELVKAAKDPRLAEVYLTLHRIYMTAGTPGGAAGPEGRS